MPRTFADPKLVLATHNPGKVVEIDALLKPFGIEVVSAGELGLPEPAETENSFEGTARLKAQAAASESGLPALADDSGLAVAALDGAPGIYSARWAGPNKDFTLAMDRVRSELGDNPAREAMFVCALTLAWPDGHDETFLGTISGALKFPPSGDKGFGYDPIFVPTGFNQTFGEMDPDKKHAMSHRAHAFEQLVAACFAKE